MYATPCSEFPNDNPELHSGAILAVEEVCGSPVVRMIGVDMDAGWAALGREIDAIVVEAKVDIEAQVEAAVGVDVDVEVGVDVQVGVEAKVDVDVVVGVGVDETAPLEVAAVEVAAAELVEVAGAVEVVDVERTDVDTEVREEPVLSRPSGIYLSGDVDDVEVDDIVITPLEPLSEAEIFGDEAPVEEPAVAAASGEACPFAELVGIMAGVAEQEEPLAGNWVRTLVGEGLAPALPADRVTSLVAAGILLADGSVAPKFDGVRRAWRAILRNESEDFGPCGALSLDEWAADAIARLLGSASRAAMVKRSLRDHGVAAFGLSLHAA
jgi:hypothetical protein